MVSIITFTLTILVASLSIHCDPLPSTPSGDAASSKPKISTDLVLDAFELFRRLLQESSVVPSGAVGVNGKEKESADHSSSVPIGAHHYSPLLRLDPLILSKPIVHEVRDAKSPTTGKIVLTLENVQFTGFSDFKVEQISNAGPCLNFQHLIPKLNTCANYTVDYHLFDSIPLRISEGAVKATIPKAKIVGRFFAFASVIGDWSRTSQFNLTTTVDDEVALMVSPTYTISDRFVLDSSMGQFDAAIRSSLPEVSEALRNAYSKVIEMKLSD
uniref:Uncharacterized protein n=1 Tax=Tetranychus urticae TaxID=32264 RepID=T1K5C9_TETUR